MTDAKEALKTFTKYAVHKGLVEKITKAPTDGGLGCESIADFLSHRLDFVYIVDNCGNHQ